MSKGLEALNKIKTQSLDVVEIDECLSIIEKELKTLEIFKNKITRLVSLIKINDDIYRIYDFDAYCFLELTKEEYELLDEAFKDD